MITVVLNVYKRPHTLLEQIEAINNQTIKPSSIMVWVNGDVILPNLPKDIIVTKCNENLKFHARFAYGLLAKTKYVAFFDDDSIPGEGWFESCLVAMEKENAIYGSTGVLLTGNAYLPNHKIGWNGLKNLESVPVHLVGHSWFMERQTLKYLWEEFPHSWDNGEDIQLSYFAKKYGGIRTLVPPHPTTDKTIWGSLPEQGMKYGNDRNATSLTTNNHMQIRNQLAAKFLKEGWDLNK